METKTFSIVTSISMVVTMTASALSVVGIAITGLYPGIIVLFFLVLIPIASKLYAREMVSKPDDFRRQYYMPLAIINVLSILVVVWMTFVILVDRVFVKMI